MKLIIETNRLLTLDEFIFEANRLPVDINNNTVGAVDSEDKEAIEDIKKIASAGVGKDDILKFLESLGIPARQTKSIFTLLLNGDWEKTYSYLLNRSISITSILGNKFNAYKVNDEKLGLSGNASKELFEFQWAASPAIGKGEVWLSLILQGGSRLGGKGDVHVDGKEVEVKARRARLMGQKGYGDAKQMPKHLLNAVVEIATELNVKDFSPIDGDANDWNFAKKSTGLLNDNLKKISALKGSFNKKDILLISNKIANTMKNLWSGLDISSTGNAFINVIDSSGNIKTEEFNKTLLKMSFAYYYHLEQFEYFAMTNDLTGNVLIIAPSMFDKYVDNGEIVYAPPSWAANAGSQGGAFAISIDKAV